MSAMTDTQWAKKNPEKHAAKSKRWADANREKTRESHRRWREANPEEYRKIQREAQVRWRKQLHADMVEAYGGNCTCCGESNAAFLTLEHIGGMKGEKRKNTASELVRLRNLGWPTDEATCFCFNCNLGSWRNGGVCPHIEDAEIVEEDS